MQELSCKFQNYAWGKLGRDSMVAKLLALQGVEIDESAPFAELWFGTHRNGPSSLAKTGQDLEDFIKSSPYLVPERGGLPFLFKVLSIGKALSIQAHPNKALAEQLHASRPDVYKDDNHKPEMAVALTPFEAMCGFRPLAEVVEHLRTVPELSTLIPEAARSAFCAGAAAGKAGPDVLPELFRVYVTAGEEAVAAAAAAVAARLGAAEGELSLTDAVVLRLTREFPGDVGVFAPYLLNVVRLDRLQGLYMGADEPHAYLSGDIVECMACSDNVVRAGLTPKLRDVNTLVDMLTYSTGQPGVVEPVAVDAETRLYRPPVPEFEIQHTTLAAGQSYSLPPVSGSSSIIVVVSGSATADAPGQASPAALSTGSVWFLPGMLRTAALQAGDDGIELFRVHTNGEGRL